MEKYEALLAAIRDLLDELERKDERDECSDAAYNPKPFTVVQRKNYANAESRPNVRVNRAAYEWAIQVATKTGATLSSVATSAILYAKEHAQYVDE